MIRYPERCCDLWIGLFLQFHKLKSFSIVLEVSRENCGLVRPFLSPVNIEYGGLSVPSSRLVLEAAETDIFDVVLSHFEPEDLHLSCRLHLVDPILFILLVQLVGYDVGVLEEEQPRGQSGHDLSPYEVQHPS